MRLHPGPFTRIQAREKEYEIRLYDEKRRKVELGDMIEFSNSENPDEKLQVIVTSIHVFKDFKDLYQMLSAALSGYDENSFVASMYDIYPPEKTKLYPAVAFGIKLQK